METYLIVSTLGVGACTLFLISWGVVTLVEGIRLRRSRPGKEGGR